MTKNLTDTDYDQMFTLKMILATIDQMQDVHKHDHFSKEQAELLKKWKVRTCVSARERERERGREGESERERETERQRERECSAASVCNVVM